MDHSGALSVDKEKAEKKRAEVPIQTKLASVD
jgi:hypothetical protein